MLPGRESTCRVKRGCFVCYLAQKAVLKKGNDKKGNKIVLGLCVLREGNK
jgi:hypothetical protein